jgi:transposase
MPVRPYDQNQSYLFPPHLMDWIPKEHPARVFSDLLDRVGIAGFQAARVEGRPRFDTRMMVKIMLWGYANGIRSSRKIEDRLESDVVFMWLAGREKPDFRTIAEFRRCNKETLDWLFAEVLVLARALGMLRLGLIALDGTKIRASAGINSFKTKAEWQKALDEARVEVTRILAEAEAQDQAEDKQFGCNRRGSEIPEELTDAQQRVLKIEQLLLAVGDRADDKLRISITDPEAHYMHSQNGSMPAYNAQIAVTEDQIIVHADVTTEPIDTNQLIPGAEGIKATTGRYPEQLLADAGFDSGRNLHELEERKIDGYLPDGAERNLGRRHRAYAALFGKEQFRYDAAENCYYCPALQILRYQGRQKTKTKYSEHEAILYKTAPGTCLACPLREQCTKVKTRDGRTISRNPYELERERMRLKLATEKGRETYGKRKCLIEPVNGQVKVVGSLRQFLLRGVEGARIEVKWSAIGHNLMKLVRRTMEGKIRPAMAG